MKRRTRNKLGDRIVTPPKDHNGFVFSPDINDWMKGKFTKDRERDERIREGKRAEA